MYARRTFQMVAFMLAAMTLSVGAIEVENYTAQSGNLKVTFKPVKKQYPCPSLQRDDVGSGKSMRAEVFGKSLRDT